MSFSYTQDEGFYHLASMQAANGERIAFSFLGPFGQLDKSTDPSGRETIFTYYSDLAPIGTAGSLQSFTTPLPAAGFTDTYNAFGRITQDRDGVGRTTAYQYGTNQDLVKVTEPSGISQCFAYDGISRLQEAFVCSRTDEKTLYYRDALNRVSSRNAPGGRITQFTYDDNSNVTSVTAPNGVKTIYAYNDQNLVSSRTEAGRTESFEYDNLGLLAAHTDKKNQRTVYTYDGKRRLKTATFADGTVLGYFYNTLDQLTRIADSSDPNSGRDVQYVYATGSDQVSRLTEELTALGGFSYSYDTDGNLERIDTLGGEGFLRYTYAADGASLASASLVGQGYGSPDLAVGFEYNGSGDLREIRYPSFTGTVVYNAVGDVDRLDYQDGSTVLRQIDYGYDYESDISQARGYLTSRTESGPGVDSRTLNRQYTYNEVGELLCTQTLSVPCPQAGKGKYTSVYDLDGNPTTVSVNNTSTAITYSGGTNRISSFGGQTIATDDNGNVTDDGVNLYEWNARDQLVKIRSKADNLEKARFVYDALGRRLSKTVGGVTTNFVYSGEQALAETATDGTIQRRYLATGGLDAVFASRGTDGEDKYHLQDALNGSVVALVSSTSGNVAVETSYGYTPFGQAVQTGAVSANPLQFAGRENDGTGVYYNRSRYYSPRLQRFLSEDPIGFSGGDTNLYRYVGNTPHIASDPTGLRRNGVGPVFGALWSAPKTASGPVPAVVAKGTTFTTTRGPAIESGTVPVTTESRVAQAVPSYRIPAGKTFTEYYSYAGGVSPGYINMSIDNLPSGLQGTFSPNPLLTNGPSNNLTLLTVPTYVDTPPGESLVTVTATNPNGSVQNRQFNLEIIPPQVDLQITGGTLMSQNITAGQSFSLYVQVSRSENFNGEVVLTAEGLGTAAFVPSATVPGDAYGTTLYITTDESTPRGPHTVIIGGTVEGGVVANQIPLVINVQPPSANMYASPPSQKLNPSGNLSFEIRPGRSEGFDDPIALTVAGAPSGVVTSLSPASIQGYESATLNVFVPPTLVIEPFEVVVSGSSGDAQITPAFAAVELPLVQLSVSPSVRSLAPGGTTAYAVNIGREPGYTKPIDMDFDRSSLPVGVSGRLDPPNPVYGNTATLTLSANSNVTQGSRSITISGTAAGAEVRPATVILNTLSSGSGGGGGGGTGVRSFALREAMNTISQTEIAAAQNRTDPLDTLQGGISVLGLVPGVGEIFDLVNAGISLGRGRYLDAAANAASALPLLGNFVAGGRFARAALRANPCGCFVAGTSVETEEGPKPIEQVKPGDRVLARDEITGKQSWKPVVRTFVFHDRPVYELELQEVEDDFSRDRLVVTADHPFWKQDVGWVAAEQLKPGDRLLSADGDWLKVGKLHLLPEKRTTHNLEVEGNHNFFVGSTQAWVHNIDCQIFTKNGILITGFTRHGVDRAIGDFTRLGVGPQAILDALKSPLKIGKVRIDKRGLASQRFVGQFGQVVVNPETGRIISVNPTSSDTAEKLLRLLNGDL